MQTYFSIVFALFLGLDHRTAMPWHDTRTDLSVNTEELLPSLQSERDDVSQRSDDDGFGTEELIPNHEAGMFTYPMVEFEHEEQVTSNQAECSASQHDDDRYQLDNCSVTDEPSTDNHTWSMSDQVRREHNAIWENTVFQASLSLNKPKPVLP